MGERIDTRPVWERLAQWWSAQVGEGNEFQLRLIMPATDRLLKVSPGENVLDIACGNGNYARRLGRAGARVTAFDGAERFIAEARARTAPADGEIDYRVIDATDEAAMLTLGPGRFDAAVCSMALMDLACIEPAFAATYALLKPGGRFVFSIPHPCFNSGRCRLTAELINEEGRLEQVYGVHILDYLTLRAEKSAGILNQPELHDYFHRPLSMLIGAGLAAGFMLDGLEEPAFPEGASAKSAFSWAKRPLIPPALVARLRR